VTHFQALLNLLSRNYAENPQQIADQTAKAQDMLAAKGLDDTIDDIMKGMMEAYTGTTHVPYTQALAGYIVLRLNGSEKG
jgi:hypothetical protein